MEEHIKHVLLDPYRILPIGLAAIACFVWQKQKLFASFKDSKIKSEKSSVVTAGKARFTVISPGLIRLEYSGNGKFMDSRTMFAVKRDSGFRDYNLTRSEGRLTIETGRMTLVYSPDGKPFSVQNLKVAIKKGNGSVEWSPGLKNTANLGGTVTTLDSVSGPIPLGEGLLSRDGWYLLDDSKTPILTEDWVAARPKDPATDWYLFGYGTDYKSALRDLTRIGGAVPLPRKEVLGAWYSRYWPYSSDDYRQIIKEYHDHDFPLDVIVMDMDWHKDGWTGWSWNRKLLPDAEDLLRWFHEQGLDVTLNLHPADGVGPHEDGYKAFMNDMGKDPANGEVIPFDAADKKYIDTLFNDIHKPLENEGVDFWWLDWQQTANTHVPGLSNLAWLNRCYYRHTSFNNKRGQSFSRWGGWGDHRHPIQFSGDMNTGWPALAFEVPFTFTAGNVGCFFWSHDIGGHWGPRSEEAYTRWVQFGAVTAALRSHSTRDPNLDRRPWKYSEQAEKAMRISFHLRSELFPYIYTSVYQCHSISLPLNRPLYLEYPDEESAYANPQEFLFGDHLLVAPIVSPGAGPDKVAIQTVWFPEGTWYNWFTGEKFKGKSDRVVSADIHEFPLYARAGVPIPTQPYRERMGKAPFTEIVLRCYPGEEGIQGNSFLYEDDGESQDYLKGACALTELSYLRQGDQVTVKVSPSKGTYPSQVKSRAYLFELPCSAKAVTAEINGKAFPVEYDEENHVNRIRISSVAPDQSLVLHASAGLADEENIRRSAALRRMRGLLENGSMKSLNGMDEIIRYAGNHPDQDLLSSLLGTIGIALYKKNEGLYLYRKDEKLLLYDDFGLLGSSPAAVTVQDNIGGKVETVHLEEYKVEKNFPTLVQASTDPVPNPPWIGASTERAVAMEFPLDGGKIKLWKKTGEKDSFLTRWELVGPFPFPRGKRIEECRYGPENGPLDLDASYKEGVNGEPLSWQKAQAREDDNVIDLKSRYNYENRIAYAVTKLLSERDQEITLWINTDDGAEVWVNGDKIFSLNIGRSIHTEPDRIQAKLKAGENTLLFKISQYGGEWEFKSRIACPYPVHESL